jgi:hypothetical protein
MPEQRRRDARVVFALLRKTRVQARIEGLDLRGWSENDYAVVDGETRVGRFYREMIHGSPKWRWFLQSVPAPRPNTGMADALEEAMAAFKLCLPSLLCCLMPTTRTTCTDDQHLTRLI